MILLFSQNDQKDYCVLLFISLLYTPLKSPSLPFHICVSLVSAQDSLDYTPKSFFSVWDLALKRSLVFLFVCLVSRFDMIQITPFSDLTMVPLCSPTNLKLHYFLPTFGCCSLIGSLYLAEFSVNELGSLGHEDTGFSCTITEDPGFSCTITDTMKILQRFVVLLICMLKFIV